MDDEIPGRILSRRFALLQPSRKKMPTTEIGDIEPSLTQHFQSAGSELSGPLAKSGDRRTQGTTDCDFERVITSRSDATFAL